LEKLLIIDDNQEIRKQLKWGLGKDYKILLAESVDVALKLFKEHHPKVVALDLGLPPDIDGATEGLRCLQAMLEQQPSCKVIVISGNEEHSNAVEAVGLGAYDFYHKPIQLDELKIILSRAFHVSALEEENQRLQARIASEGRGYSGLFGSSPQMQQIFATIKKIASVDVPVLVLGESGTGKELVARAIHDKSLRSQGPFIPINCSAIPENLLEAELFGHEKGAFTGAHACVQGKFEFAHGGTLFLDEIGDMPILLQVKLLRFLQEKVIQRVGGREDIRVDARIVAATNIDIEEAISKGLFREDLYYRISVVTAELPPLRERGEDINLLANLFMRRYADEFKRRVKFLSASSLKHLNDYNWPGNIRELENKMKRAVVMSEAQTIEPWDLGFNTASEDDEKNPVTWAHHGLDFTGMTLKEARSIIDKKLLATALDAAEGNLVKAAESLGVSRPTIYDLMKKHGFYVEDPTE
jgi:two-component system NtrC family response regulator